MVKQVTIPYTPRKHFVQLHNSAKRFKFVVAHRRAGKTVAIVNHMIRAALQNNRQNPPPRYAYVGPSFSQAKDLVWGYLKHYTADIQRDKSEGELWVELLNGARITLYGGSGAHERMRGLYFDGIAMDEYPLLDPTAFTSVVRPALADYLGWAILSGTPKGEDHFFEMKNRAEAGKDWEVFIIPVTSTDALSPDEVKDMTEDMTADEYAREMLCSFSAAIVGAYYGEELNQIALSNRITKVPYQKDMLVHTMWDLGIDDQMSIWFYQRNGREHHFIDYIAGSDRGLDHYAMELRGRPYNYGYHLTPHDIAARELSSGTSRYDTLTKLLQGRGEVFKVPQHKVEDGITAVRSMLSASWFDEERTSKGIAALRSYQKNKLGKPLHNWASHGADAIRTGAVGINYVLGWGGNVTSLKTEALRRRIPGLVKAG